MAAKEKWVWGGGCGCECGCIGRWGQGRNTEPGQGQSFLLEGGRKVKTRRLGCNPLLTPPLQNLLGPWSPAYAPGILANGSNTGAEELGLMGTQGLQSWERAASRAPVGKSPMDHTKEASLQGDATSQQKENRQLLRSCRRPRSPQGMEQEACNPRSQ